MENVSEHITSESDSSASANGQGGNTESIAQVAHGFTKVGTPIYQKSDGDFAKVLTDGVDPITANAIGVVGEIVDVDNFVAVYGGLLKNIDLLVLTTGSDYYGSDVTAGELITTQVSSPSIVVPIMTARSPSSAVVTLQLGLTGA